VGDVVWDMQACVRAGIGSVGGIGEGELRAAGAEDIYDDAADLLAQLSGSRLGPPL
jgi:hypothetical protein